MNTFTIFLNLVHRSRIHTMIKQLERVQKRFTRMIYRKFHYPTEPYETRLSRLEMFSLENRRLLTDESVPYKVLNDQFNTSVKDTILVHNPIRIIYTYKANVQVRCDSITSERRKIHTKRNLHVV